MSEASQHIVSLSIIFITMLTKVSPTSGVNMGHRANNEKRDLDHVGNCENRREISADQM